MVSSPLSRQRISNTATSVFLLASVLFTASARSSETKPVATFSIVAIDPETGEIGVAVQSKIVGVGAIVPFAKAGVGAVATQSYANTGYGPLGLLAFESDLDAAATIELLTRDDPLKSTRQVGVISANGDAASFTGADCHEWAGGKTGENYAVQGNILAGPEVIEAMTEAFENAKGVLAERLLAALAAGQEAGGDQRGRQSASLLIVRSNWGYGGVSDRFRDVRVDDHPTPIAELERVYRLHRDLFPRPK
ncbi:MAG: fimbrial assembly protein FimA [Verrucomicrobiales bacterium]|nr:fimbrial assembly protein FimA [Verrucomicrobiales bacterium]|tara:strand:+ start:14278 stop:15027 length:750 start_codon:yes stop_codon:yes gene_type:complete